MNTCTPRELFGGAITALLPSHAMDASDLRQVPDTQEVFIFADSGASIIIEILEKVDATDPIEAAKFHFKSLAHDNSADSATILDTVLAPTTGGNSTPAPIALRGSQLVRKFNKQVADEVQILMGLYRIESKDIDLVVTMNLPLAASEQGDAVNEQGIALAQARFDDLIRSLQIVDYGLFA